MLGLTCVSPPLRTQVYKLVGMALIPRWQYMTDSSKSLVKRSAIGVVVVLIGLTLLRLSSRGSCWVLPSTVLGVYSTGNRR